MQYGFKKKHSTTLCTVVLKELVQHYREGNSDVYCCLLDASKAFDRIHYGELFTLLLSTKMPVKILRPQAVTIEAFPYSIVFVNCMIMLLLIYVVIL